MATVTQTTDKLVTYAAAAAAKLAAAANLDDAQATQFLGVAPGTLNVWRCRQSVKIPYFKLGKKVMYRRVDLEAYIADHIVGQVAE